MECWEAVLFFMASVNEHERDRDRRSVDIFCLLCFGSVHMVNVNGDSYTVYLNLYYLLLLPKYAKAFQIGANT